jgi:superfamily II DNA helicase RecQ
MMPTARPFIRYNVDEVINVNDEIIQQIIKWDWDKTNSYVDRAIVYCLIQHFVEQLALKINNITIYCVHLYAHLDNDTKHAQLQSWVLGEIRVMVVTRVIEYGYNYLYVELLIHRGSLIFFVTLHQEFD